MVEDGPGRGHLCHTDTFLVSFHFSAVTHVSLTLLYLSFTSFPLLSFFSLSLGDDAKWPTRIEVCLNHNSGGPHSLVDKRADSKSIRFLTTGVTCGKAKFCLRMVRWFFPRFSGFRPPLMNDQLYISEIFLKGP